MKEQNPNKLWNTPNKISLARILLIPLVVFFYLATFIPFGKLVATILFVVACLTDFVDGHLARKNNQVTDFGKFFDSIADKALIMAGMILICSAPAIGSAPITQPTWLGIACVIIMLGREFIISALRQIAASKGVVLAADKGGKIKATVQYVSVTLYMIFAFIMSPDVLDYNSSMVDDKAYGIVHLVLMIIFVLTTLITIYTGASYLIRNRKVFYNDYSPNFVAVENKADKAEEKQITNDVVAENENASKTNAATEEKPKPKKKS